MESIKTLLDRYFEGETTSAEEQRLRAYFAAGKDIPEELRYAAGMFAFFGESRATCLPERPRKVRLRLWHGVVSAAAVVALVMASVLFLKPDRPDQPATIYGYVNGVPISDRAEAEAYAEQSLELVSELLALGSSME
jgi:hypothetical protein